MPESDKPQVPPEFPETPPQRYPMTDYSFTLQSVMDLQKSFGQMTARLDEIAKKIDGQGDKLNSISHQIYAAWAIIIVFGIIGGFLINHLWDPITKLLVKALLEAPTH